MLLCYDLTLKLLVLLRDKFRGVKDWYQELKGNEEDDAEVINPYEEAGPHNRPPPTSDEETEFAPPVVQIADVDDVSIPPVIQFGSKFHIGESSAMRELLAGNNKVYALGPMCCDLNSVHKGVKRLSKQMHDSYRTERKMAGKLRQAKLHMNGQEFDITALDSAVRENRLENSKMMKMIEGRIPSNLRFQEEPSIYTASLPRAGDPYVMVRDAAMFTQEDEDDDPYAPRDIQPFKPRGSPHNSQTMLPRKMTQANTKRLIADAIAQDRATRGSTGRVRGSGGAVELCHWFERIESVINLGLEVANRKSWTELKTMIKKEFCPPKEIQRMEVELWNLRVKDLNIAAYTQRFNELVLICLKSFLSERKKVEAYIRGLPKIIKGEMTSSRPVVLNEAIRMAHTLMEQKFVAKAERIAKSNKRKWENNNQVATLGHEVAKARSWAEVKQMMTDEFCPTEEV
uniref:Retrotransposon gag domain-containing protein n=1 Tax=Tanacetum cinerariifolium TaxID=118510 RepID=A0A699H5M8_TANCI|nr:hypothetical protein [Tanacetum cinerariifolium]